jgi:hypothetical protein
MSVTRREFVRIVPGLGTFAVGVDAVCAQAQTQAPAPDPLRWPAPPPAQGSPKDDSFPSQHPFLARDIVGVAHRDLARVKELVGQHQALAKAAWDWGYGDWETALGSASHTGNRAIAEFLIENGAQPTIFSAAMLGQLDVVKGFAAAMPDVHRLRGPHGIPLALHARAGGPQASAVLAFIESIGVTGLAADLEPLGADDRAAIEGRYLFGDRPRDAFIVETVQGRLNILRQGAERRALFHLAKLEFHPAGAPGVRIKFEKSAAGMALTVFDPDPVVRAVRT